MLGFGQGLALDRRTGGGCRVLGWTRVVGSGGAGECSFALIFQSVVSISYVGNAMLMKHPIHKHHIHKIPYCNLATEKVFKSQRMQLHQDQPIGLTILHLRLLVLRLRLCVKDLPLLGISHGCCARSATWVSYRHTWKHAPALQSYCS